MTPNSEMYRKDPVEEKKTSAKKERKGKEKKGKKRKLLHLTYFGVIWGSFLSL